MKSVVTLAGKTVAVVSGFASTGVSARFVEAERVFVTLVRANVTLVDVNAGRFVVGFIIEVFKPDPIKSNQNRYQETVKKIELLNF